jgi:protein involved in polysaccharide export with SLBB domain
MNPLFFNILRYPLMLSLMVASLVSSGCVTKSANKIPAKSDDRGDAVTASSSEKLESPVEEALKETFSDFILGVGDEIDIQIFREPELSGKFTLDQDGRFRHPLMGMIAVAGMSVADAEKMITGLLDADFLVNPRVIVTLTKTLKSQVVILGEVKNPGIYPVPVNERTTLLQVIALSGGFTGMASPDRVKIVRRKDDGTVTIPARVSDMLSGRGKQRDIELEPDDVIMVPKIIF